MQKKFLANLSFLLLLNLLIKPFYILGIDAEVQNQVGADEYGLYFSILNFSFIFNILNDFGITNYNNRTIAQNVNALQSHFGKLMVSRIFLCLAYTAVTFGGAVLLNYSSKQLYLLGFLVINQIIVSYILFMRSNLAGLHLFKRDSIISVLDRFLMIVFCGLLLWGNVTDDTFKIEWFVYLQTLSYLISFGIAFIFLKGKILRLGFRFDLVYILAILKKSVPYAILILLMSIYYRVDGVMLERMLPTAEEAGIYAQGYRFLEALNNFSFLFSVLLFPIFSRMLAQNQNIASLTALSTKILLSAVILLCITCWFYQFEIMDWRYEEHIDEASKTFGILILNGIAVATTYIFGTLLTAAGKLKTLNITALFFTLGNIILNYLLIPKFFALGSAWASFITLFGSAIVQIVIVQHYFRFKLNPGLLFRMFLFAMMVVGLCVVFKSVEFTWLIEMILIGGIGLGISFAIGLFRVNEFLQILREEKPLN